MPLKPRAPKTINNWNEQNYFMAIGRWTQSKQKRKAFVVSMVIREPLLDGPFDKKHAPPSKVGRINAERIALIGQLMKLGYRVAVPKYAEAHNEKLFSRLPAGVRVFNAKPPLSGIVKIAGANVPEMDSSARWVRDLWQKTPYGRVKRFSGAIENAFGEGARSLFLPNNVVIANETLKGNRIVEEFKKRGTKFYFVKSVKKVEGRFMQLQIGIANGNRQQSRPRQTKIISENYHIDQFLGAVGNVLLVDSRLYLQNFPAVRGAAKSAGLKILFVPREERNLHPANFLVLEPTKVMVDKDAKKTIALLRQNGVEVIPTAVPLRGNRKSEGGVHCIVNEL
ncbi:MAG: hypothetical protein Q8N60_04580 [Candidatus Diapherotrites archaeon]|nr:hypothetical protein [Candidatus Diapherotrites archaeon]